MVLWWMFSTSGCAEMTAERQFWAVYSHDNKLVLQFFSAKTNVQVVNKKPAYTSGKMHAQD